jgi:predicted DNA binding CopG/RHH family protein
MTTKTKTIRCRVDDQTKQAFNEMATNHGLTESELLALVINGVINKTDKQNISTFFTVGKKLTKLDAELIPITFKMPRFLTTAAKEKAKAQGMTTSRWIKSLVQSNLIQPPVLIDSAIIAIRESNRELSAVGNNLNQIARRLNETVFKTDMVRIELIKDVEISIDKVRLLIDELIRVTRNGWRVDNG